MPRGGAGTTGLRAPHTKAWRPTTLPPGVSAPAHLQGSPALPSPTPHRPAGPSPGAGVAQTPRTQAAPGDSVVLGGILASASRFLAPCLSLLAGQRG